MTSRYLHTNFNVFDLAKVLLSMRKRWGLTEERRVNGPDGAFIIVFLGDSQTDAQLELTWVRDRKTPYDLGDKEFHIAYRVPDKKQAHSLHEEMGCICYEKP